MSRASKLCAAALIAIGLAIFLIPTSDVSAVDGGDTIRVYGVGPDAETAEANAYENMNLEILDIIMDLPPNEVIIDVIVDDEGSISNTLYFIDFHVITGPPGGGGSGGGGGPGGGGPG